LIGAKQIQRFLPAPKFFLSGSFFPFTPKKRASGALFPEISGGGHRAGIVRLGKLFLGGSLKALGEFCPPIAGGNGGGGTKAPGGGRPIRVCSLGGKFLLVFRGTKSGGGENPTPAWASFDRSSFTRGEPVYFQSFFFAGGTF